MPVNWICHLRMQCMHACNRYISAPHLPHVENPAAAGGTGALSAIKGAPYPAHAWLLGELNSKLLTVEILNNH